MTVTLDSVYGIGTTGASADMSQSTARHWGLYLLCGPSEASIENYTPDNSSNAPHSDEWGAGTYTAWVSGLSPGTTYYVRACSPEYLPGEAWEYSAITSFTTAAGAPSVSTDSVTAVTGTTATVNANVSSGNGASVTSRGICWGTGANPTTANSSVSCGSGTGGFSGAISGLSISTTHHARAWATNSAGTTYGADISFSTPVVPTLTTAAIPSPAYNAAAGGGTVTSDGGATVTVRGVCWKATTGPTIADAHTSESGGSGAFTSTLIGLDGSTTYHAKAYATTIAGTGYGPEVDFTTPAMPATFLAGGLGRSTVWGRALSAAEALAAYNAGQSAFSRSLAKGTIVITGEVQDRKGAPVPAIHVRAGWGIQNLDYQPDPALPPPVLAITGHSVDLAGKRNALTIGQDWMEREIGVRMAELLAMPATPVPDEAPTDPYEPDAPYDPGEPDSTDYGGGDTSGSDYGGGSDTGSGEKPYNPGDYLPYRPPPPGYPR